MAGSLNHIVDDNGRFTMDTIEHLGDAHEALEECFNVIGELSNWNAAAVNTLLEHLGYPTIAAGKIIAGENNG